jgi:hypothetical protein
MKWIGLYGSSIKHASTDGVNSLCGLIDDYKKDSMLTSFVRDESISLRSPCHHCALKLPWSLKRKVDDLEAFDPDKPIPFVLEKKPPFGGEGDGK